MSALQWIKEDYCVYIPAIDSEHKLLIAIVNDFESALNMDCSLHAQIIPGKLAILSEIIKKHFESEEQFLLVNNYPWLEEQKSQHAQLLEQLAKFESRFKAEKSAFNDKMLLFLKDWLIRHLILYDRKFGNYFNGKELVSP